MAETTDLMLSRSPDTIFVQALTERGSEFIDAYTALEFMVLDSGYIAIPTEGEFALVARAREEGLTVL